MALFERVEFFKNCGVDPSDSSIYIRRQKVYITQGEDGKEYVNDQLPANAEFLRHRRQKMLEKQAEGQNAAKPAESAKKTDTTVKKQGKSAKKETPAPKKQAKLKKSATPAVQAEPEIEVKKEVKAPEFVPPTREELLQMGIKTRNAWLESEKLRMEIEEKQLKADKMAGLLVPVEPTRDVMKQYARNITNKFVLIMGDMLTDMAQQHNMSGKEVGDVRKVMIERINKAVDEVVNDGMSSVETIVNEFTDKRGRGERIS